MKNKAGGQSTIVEKQIIKQLEKFKTESAIMRILQQNNFAQKGRLMRPKP